MKLNATLIGIIGLLAGTPLLAAEPDEAAQVSFSDSAPVVTAEARAALDRMTQFLSGLQKFSITATSTRDQLLPYGYKVQLNESAKLSMERPNKLRVDVDGDIKHRSYYYDGSKLIIVAPDDGAYTRIDAPETIEATISGLLNAGVEMPLMDVLRQGKQGALLEGVRYGLRVGESSIGGVPTDHLAFRQASIDWQIWIAKNGEPKKILITTRYEVGDPQYQVVLDWDTKPKLEASTFRFVPGADMTDVPLFVGANESAVSIP